MKWTAVTVAAMALAACAAPRGPNGGGDDDGTSDWTGIRVSGTGFVDGAGHPFLPRGLGIGEWLNVESYMLGLELVSDVPGLGSSRLRAALVAAIGDADTERFFATWQANLVTEDDVAEWARWGVNTVRVPLNHHAISYEQLDRFVGWCKAHGVYVILDLHAAPGSQNCEEMSDSPDGVAHLWTEPATYRDATIALWRELAAHYRDEPAVAGYDILDEPYDTEATGDFSTGVATLRAFYVDVTAAIREVDPHHVLFFEGTRWSGPDGFAGLAPAWDPQMAWAFHKYWDANTDAAIRPYLDLRAATGRPVWNGETGEDESTGWSAAMIALLERHDIGWNMWTFKKVENSANYYSIRAPAGWPAMKRYLEGGAAPPRDAASATMLELAANAATPACELQRAWLEQTFGAP
jgi:endoglucanase